MAANDWTAFADELITDFGDEFGNGAANPICYHIKKTVTGGTNPLDPASVVETLEPMNAVFTSVTKDMIDGTLVQLGDISVVATYSGVITPSDLIERDGKKYVVITVDPVNPYGQSIVKKLIARAQ